MLSALDSYRPAVLLASLLALASGPVVAAGKASSEVDIMKLSRPAEGEWMGLYLQGKKAGWAFNKIEDSAVDGRPAVKVVNEIFLSAMIGNAKTERHMREERTYERKNGGHLLSLVVDKTGDGGEEHIVATKKGDQIEMVITRPNHPTETRTLPASAETLEQADPARLAIALHKKIAGVTLDEDELADKGSVSEPMSPSEIVYSGVTVKVNRASTVEEKDNLKVISSYDPTGRLVEVRFGEPPVMVGKAEPEETAKKLEVVDLFALTRVPLDAEPPPTAYAPPAKLVMKVKGLTAAFEKPNPRQTYKPLSDGIVEVTIATHEPTTKISRPEAAITPELTEALKSSLQVESADPQIAALAKELVGNEHDAWTAAKILSKWVNRNVQSVYGASSDRATDVLLRKKGDCTEHALLFTALARAAGIPARRVDGLVYMPTDDHHPALYWHEWAEVWVGEWISIDPTFNEEVADATHLALGAEEHGDSAALIGQLSISLR